MASTASAAQARRAIVDLLAQRAPEATICPSEVARLLAHEGQSFRPLMALVRQAAGSLAARGEVQVTQRGTVVDVARARGPVRIGRAPKP